MKNFTATALRNLADQLSPRAKAPRRNRCRHKPSTAIASMTSQPKSSALTMLNEFQGFVDMQILSGRLAAKHRGWLPVFMVELSTRPIGRKKSFEQCVKEFASTL